MVKMTLCYHWKIGQSLRKELDTKNKYILERISVVLVHLLILQTYQAIVKPNPAPSLLLVAIEKSVTTTTSKVLQNKSNYYNNARLYVVTRGYPPLFLCTPHEPTPCLACTFAVYVCLCNPGRTRSSLYWRPFVPSLRGDCWLAACLSICLCVFVLKFQPQSYIFIKLVRPIQVSCAYILWKEYLKLFDSGWWPVENGRVISCSFCLYKPSKSVSKAEYHQKEGFGKEATS